MKNSRLWASLLGFTLLTTALFVFNIATGRSPVLGLDLKGGLSVIYATAEPATQEDLIVVRDLMRDQLESFGIAEPDVRVEGEHIIVDLPGVSNQDEAFEALQVSGIVELRPVLQCQAITPPESTVPGSSVPTTTTPDASVDSESSLGGAGTGGRYPRVFPMTAPTTTTPVATTPPTTAPPLLGPAAPTTTLSPEALGQDVLLNIDGSLACIVGPAGATGEVFVRKSASVGINPTTGQWNVSVDLRSDGQDAWNALAAECNGQTATCPSGQLAIVLDDTIQSAPSVNQPFFSDPTVEISGAFTESEVRDLAMVLNRGAFPVEVVQQRVETVSATAGTDALRAAAFAGLVGVAIMLLYMAFYYRKLSVIILLSLIVWAMLVFSMASFASNQWNYAFMIAGATGLIISVGVTVDTYVVFFERIRDEVRHGRSYLNASIRSFKSTWRTILAANFVSFLAAVVLFWLSVGSVKGFALYLGMTTVCDVLIFYFVSRPATILIAQTGWFDPRSKRVSKTAAKTGDTPAIGATS